MARAFHSDQKSLYNLILDTKRDGSVRQINAPNWQLRFMQKRVADLLVELYRPSSRANGFIKGRGIRRNASSHVNKRLILNVDIKDYFGSIHIGRIRRRLMARPYSLPNEVATTIAKLCTLDGALPIGSPASPVIANMLSSTLDYDLASLAKDNGCYYTRYADDITFSTHRLSFPSGLVVCKVTDGKIKHVAGEQLSAVCAKSGFILNETKTRVLTRGDRQEVCGITTNEVLSPRRRLRRQIRGMINAWRTFGLEKAEAEWNDKHNWRKAKSFEGSLRGKVAFLIHIRGENDASTANIVSQFNSLEPRAYRDIEYEYLLDWKINIDKMVCVIESGNDNLMEYLQGSGFLIGNGYIVTNAHNIIHGDFVMPEIIVRFPGHIKDDIPVSVVELDKTRDFAILKPKESAWLEILSKVRPTISFEPVTQEQSVWLAGFPSYLVGEEFSLNPGSVTGRLQLNGLTYFKISQMIVKGNSGGPVFDAVGRVVGIATRGLDTHDVANVLSNGCLFLSDFDKDILPLVSDSLTNL